MSALWCQGIPDLLEMVNQVEELLSGVIYAITLGASVDRRPWQRESQRL